MSKTVATLHLDVRISAELYSMLNRAAGLQRCNMTDFVVDAVQSPAQRVIELANAMPLSGADQDQVVRTLLSPPEPAPALQRAFVRRNKLFGVE